MPAVTSSKPGTRSASPRWACRTVLQSNVSTSAQGVLRGLHYQWPRPQGKLVSVLEGEVYDVAVDIRRGSPTFGQWDAVVLSAENKKQFWIPEGFAHGFAVLSERAVFSYLCTEVYLKDFDAGVRWNDVSPWTGQSVHRRCRPRTRTHRS